MTELRSVSGSWPRAAVEVAYQKSLGEGWMTGIEKVEWVSGLRELGDRREKRTPMAKTIMAKGSLGKRSVVNRNRAAASAHKRLSLHNGPVQLRGPRSEDPALRQRDKPAPTWMPFTTGTGVILFAQLTNPVMLNKPTRLATTNPAAAVSSLENLRATATAAMAFIGCTGRGAPNVMPVTIFAAPVNRSVEGRDIEFVRTKAVMSGSKVPRSPREPDSSASGASLKVEILCLLMLRRWGIGFRMVKETMLDEASCEALGRASLSEWYICVYGVGNMFCGWVVGNVVKLCRGRSEVG
jgi:hypothetical protein